MRAFIAIKLPQNIQQTISKIQSEIKASGADIKWVPPANIHLTLKFLGDIDEQTKNAVIESMQQISADTPQFMIKTGVTGTFPEKGEPRVIWLGLAAGDEETTNIAHQLENALQFCDIAKETHEFSSHITIGRVRSSRKMHKLVESLTELEEKKQIQKEFKAEKITLFMSTLTPAGPIYEVLYETILRIN